MKKCLFVFVCLFMTVLQLIAQTNPGDGFLFGLFERGLIKYRNNTQVEALLNYNTIEQEFLFLSGDNTTVLAINDPQNIDMITIGHRYFIPVEKDIFYEMLKAGKTNLYVQWQSKFVSEGKGTAYGGRSGSAAISNVSTFHGTGGSGFSEDGLLKRLITDEQFKANTECIYYVILNDKYCRFTSIKSFTRIYKQYKEQIKKYVAEHPIDFEDPDSVCVLVEYVSTL